MRCLALLFLLSLLAEPLAGWAQDRPSAEAAPALEAAPPAEVGLPFFYEHFSRQHYGNSLQHWAIAQGRNGFIYVANDEGVLEYDGTNWRLIETHSVVRSLAVADDGWVYIGTGDDLGLLTPDSTGSLQFVSLQQHLPFEEQGVKDVWGTHATSEGVFFQTSERLYRWHADSMMTWPAQHDFHTSFVVNDQVFVRDFKVGLKQVTPEGLRLVPGGEFFARQRIFMMAPYIDDRIVVATREDGLFLYDGANVVPFATEIDAAFDTYRLYHGCALPGGFYALSMLDGGVFIIDADGRLVHHFDEVFGLDDWVNFLFVDRQGGLWMALDSEGLLRVDLPTPLTVFDQRWGLSGIIADVQRHRGRLYVATGQAVFQLPQEGESLQERESPVVTIRDAAAFALQDADSLLFAGTDPKFIVQHQNGSLEEKEFPVVFAITESRQAPATFYLGTNGGLWRMAHTAPGWTFNQLEHTELETDIHKLIEDASGNLWAIIEGKRLIRIGLDEAGAVESVKEFGRQHGLPPGQISLHTADGAPLFATVRGVYRFDPVRLRFEPDTALNAAARSEADSLLSFFAAPEGSFWMAYKNHFAIARRHPDGRLWWEAPPELQFPKNNADHVSIYVEDDGVAWIGDGDRLIRYDPRIERRYDQPFSAYVRQIASNVSGQVLYTGQQNYAGAAEPGETDPLVFDNLHNELRFHVTATSFNNPAATQYQYFLEGHDEAWSAWTTASTRIYRKLAGATYTLHVRARNAQGITSEASLGFRVLPPWYRTWWAYSLFFSLALVGAALYWRYYTVLQENKRAQEQARELARERHVNERLQQANRRLQEANDSLKQVNKLKDEFLANTSHELRTPLTAILGFTSLLQEELPADYQDFLDPIESNGQRLLRTVNALLDIAKLRAGMMEVHRVEINVADQVAEVVRLLAPLAQRKDLLVELVRPPRPVFVCLDPQFLERIFYNLVGNAIKFTERGKVSIYFEEENGRVQIHVSDTGVGIDSAFIPHLFDEFKQESTGLARLHEGSGLGLAITSRLVQLLEGEISVKSEKGQGSTFTVSFPVYVPASREPAAPRTNPTLQIPNSI